MITLLHTFNRITRSSISLCISYRLIQACISNIIFTIIALSWSVCNGLVYVWSLRRYDSVVFVLMKTVFSILFVVIWSRVFSLHFCERNVKVITKNNVAFYSFRSYVAVELYALNMTDAGVLVHKHWALSILSTPTDTCTDNEHRHTAAECVAFPTFAISCTNSTEPQRGTRNEPHHTQAHHRFVGYGCVAQHIHMKCWTLAHSCISVAPAPLRRTIDRERTISLK